MARAAIPDLQKTLAENAVVDLSLWSPMPARTWRSAVAEFRRNAAGIALDAGVTDVRLAGVQFDATTLRIIAEADGTIRVQINKLGPPPDGAR